MRTEAGLALYLLLARQPGGPGRTPADDSAPVQPRPPGHLIWIACGSADHLPESVGLIAALKEAGVAASVLVTLPDGAPGPTANGAAPPLPPKGVVRANGPADTQTELRAFTDHWKPDVVAFVGGRLQPGLIHQLHLRDIPLYHFAADAPQLVPVTPGWLSAASSGLLSASLRRFTRILARGPEAARALIRAGAPAHQVEISGDLQDGQPPLPYAEAERSAMTQLLGPRPVWLAVNIPEAEEDLILAAHEAAQRHSHRLLLILIPRDPRRGPDLAERLQQGLSQRVARRGAEEYPDEETSIYIADTDDELGLWCRLATITFFGGTLTGNMAPQDAGPHPFAPASLGSAVILGPEVPAAYHMAIEALVSGQAARRVRHAGDLAEAIGELLAPDKAAAQALNAWQVISDRDAATERAARLLRDALPPAPPAKTRP